MLSNLPIIVSLLLLLVASIGSAVNWKDKGKRILDDTSFEPQQSSPASKRPQHSGSPQQFHRGNEPQQKQASPLRHESKSQRVRPQPQQFSINSVSSDESTSDSDYVEQSSGHFATVSSEDEDEDENENEDSDYIDETTAFTAQRGSVTRSKQPADRHQMKYQKLIDGIKSLNEDLVAANQKLSDANWRTLDAYGQYILWLEKILLENQKEIRISLTAGSATENNAQQPESLGDQIHLFELYIKNAEENEESNKSSNKKIFRVDPEEISNNMGEVFEKKIEGISNQAVIKEVKRSHDTTKNYPKIIQGKWILLRILPKLDMKKPQDLTPNFAMDWAKKYAKKLREQFLINYANELAQPPDFFKNQFSTELPEPELVTVNEEPNEELEREEWDSFEKKVRSEMGLEEDSKKRLGFSLIYEAYRRDILWLESLLLSYRKEIFKSLAMNKHNHKLIPTFRLFLKNAETNQKYEKTPAGNLFKLTPAEIANDPVAKKINDALQIVGKTETQAAKKKLYDMEIVMAKQALFAILPKVFRRKLPDRYRYIRNMAFELARQYRKCLRENYLASFENDWEPITNIMPHILKQKKRKSATASTKSTGRKQNRPNKKKKRQSRKRN